MTTLNVSKSPLNQLAKVYPKQARNLTAEPILIRVDDRDSSDSYPGFCDIHLKMSAVDATQFTLLLDNVPYDDHVREIATSMDGTWQSSRTGERLTLNLPADDCGNIRGLAKAIADVVGRGKRYLDPNWKWIARRTAKSLERLVRAISKGT